MWWKSRGKSLDLSRRAAVMGILNVTPDSFSDGGRHDAPAGAWRRAKEMIAEGVDIIDIGGESTRPGAAPVDADDEIARILPVIQALRKRWSGWISIDTMKPEVARAALAAGADIVNDVTGLREPAMVELCRETGCGVVVMHMKGEPRTMQQAPHYEDVVAEVREFFQLRHAELRAAGISEEALVYDPGIGFGKTLEHNLALLRATSTLAPHGRPLLIGLSRKAFIGKLLEGGEPLDRDWATVAFTAWTREEGAIIHRVHEVRRNREALRMVEAVLEIAS
ncbi:dihydropteroate synthase [Haloferula luteola]|uniref:Dihydropteroate synthase n=1 Tax=Haloferula luteola TaxID=595692 RepID=A0A840VBP4_9BACT|nr:dihydropteroate synthase [Haloferula luteola]MBB5351229.1 dihydropteroate synthase [Haloferula luteola]